jgi:site-specific recombinase XerD
MTIVFTSPLAPVLREFLEFKRRRGYRYIREELRLRDFDQFMAARVRPGRSWQLDEASLEWLASRPGRQPRSVSLDMVVMRQFWLYVRRHHPRRCRREIRWPKLSSAEMKPFIPYVLTIENVRLLLRLATSLEHPPFQGVLYRALLLVLYCTGLRFGEALRLRICDVDLPRKVIFVDESKGRSRWVPFDSSLQRELIRYLRVRREFPAAGSGDRFFVGTNQAQLSPKTAWRTIAKLYRKAGLKPSRGRVGPRPYDVRHTFAVHRLTRWYREGVDLHAHLPWLSAYMGHIDLLGTQTYLTATPELLALVARRFHRRFASRSSR